MQTQNPLNRRLQIDLVGAPLDLGGARRGCDMGPSAFRVAGLVEELEALGYEIQDHGDVPVSFREARNPGDEHARYLDGILKVCDQLRQKVVDSLRDSRLPLVIGGDHSIAIGTVAGVSQYYQEKDASIGLIWIDAHADMNTPDSSPSGNVHGMPLSVLIGNGPESAVRLGGFGPKVAPENVALIGIRDLDETERRIVAASGVNAFTMKEIDRLGMSHVAERALAVATKGTVGLHVSLDLDSLDPQVAPGVGTPVQGGLTFRETHLLLELIADSGQMRAMDVVEQNPILDDRNKTAQIGVELIQSALGRQILEFEALIRLRTALVLALLSTLSLAWTLPRLQVDRSLSQLFPEGSQSASLFADFERAFGTDDTLLVVVHDEGEPAVFREECLRYLDRLTEAYEGDPAVDSVYSVANLQTVRLRSLFGLTVPRPVPLLDPDRAAGAPSDLESLRRNPFLRCGLLSEDGRSAACWLLLDPGWRDSPEYQDQARRLKEALPPPPEGLSAVMTGFPLLQGAAQRQLQHDGLRLLLGALAVVLGVGVVLRVPWDLLLRGLASWPVVAALLAWWAAGTGRSLHVFSPALGPLLLVVSASTLLHLQHAVQRASVSGLRSTLRACAWSALSTAIGFGVLASSGLPPLAALGVELAAGALLTFGVSAAFLLGARPLRGEEPEAAPAMGQSPGLSAPGPPASSRGGRLAIAGLGLLCLPWFLLASPRPAGDWLRASLPPADPELQALQAAERAMGGVNAFEVVVALPRGEAEQRLADPEFHAALQSLQDDLLRSSEGQISDALSVVSLVSQLATECDRLNGGDAGPQTYRVTEEAVRIGASALFVPYLRFFAGRPGDASQEEGSNVLAAFRDAMRQLLSRSGDRLRIGCRVGALAGERVLALRDRLQAELFPRHAEALGLAPSQLYVTGYSVLVAEAAREVRASQHRALAIGGAVLAALLLLLSGGRRAALAALTVNAASLCGLLNLVVWLEVPLDMHAVLLTAAFLAICVDDTLHVMVCLRRHPRTGPEWWAVRRAVLRTSLALLAGFSIFALSELPAHRRFAGLIGAGITLALAWDLWILPRWLRPAPRPGARQG